MWLLKCVQSWWHVELPWSKWYTAHRTYLWRWHTKHKLLGWYYGAYVNYSSFPHTVFKSILVHHISRTRRLIYASYWHQTWRLTHRRLQSCHDVDVFVLCVLSQRYTSRSHTWTSRCQWTIICKSVETWRKRQCAIDCFSVNYWHSYRQRFWL